MVQAIMMDPFDIEAERRLIEVERTGSSHYISSQQMDAMPLDQVIHMVEHMPGPCTTTRCTSVADAPTTLSSSSTA
jgi:hypothetical protein